ncbi:hypothetical protein QBC47DRAFT_391725 [Echria macrotheca]|uniref:Uncharacterized protein n=1 Tax=Echria macrotheca TaxID=438768 RepID=A0AAJ0F5I4_9PEZI|nr:hypothetical protein QBC47DRAFT_391725 [Echria macrotheca]
MTSLWDDASTRRGGMRLPKVREKLSSLVRRGSTRTLASKRTTEVVTAVAPPVLDVDLKRIESVRLTEGWLEEAKAPPSPGSRRRQRGADCRDRRGGNDDPKPGGNESERRYSKTPIADLFAISTDQLASTLDTLSRKPTNTPADAPSAPGPVAVGKADKQDTATAEAPPAVPPEPLEPIRISLKKTVVDPVITPVPEAPLPRGRLSWRKDPLANLPTSSTDDVSQGPQRHAVRHTTLLRSVGPNTTGLRVTTGGSGPETGVIGVGPSTAEISKRYSMPTMPEVVPSVPTPRNASMPSPLTITSAPRSTSSDRRRSWQPPQPSPTLAQTPTGTMAPPLRRTGSTRPPSVALTSSRLAWINELEKKSTPSPSETQRLALKGGGGSVASKLAMFEQKAKQPVVSTSSLSRSNSTASSSRLSSSVAWGEASVVGAGAIPSTARTSIDSTRSSAVVGQRNSAVMAYYDEGFRERMEGLVAVQLGKDKDKKKGGEGSASSSPVDGGNSLSTGEVEVKKLEETESADVSAETKPEPADVAKDEVNFPETPTSVAASFAAVLAEIKEQPAEAVKEAVVAPEESATMAPISIDTPTETTEQLVEVVKEDVDTPEASVALATIPTDAPAETTEQRVEVAKDESLESTSTDETKEQSALEVEEPVIALSGAEEAPAAEVAEVRIVEEAVETEGVEEDLVKSVQDVPLAEDKTEIEAAAEPVVLDTREEEAQS